MLRLAVALALAALLGIVVGLAAIGRIPNWAGQAGNLKSLIEATVTGSDAGSRSPWDDRYFPNDPVVTHEGRTFRFYDDLIKDKIVVVNFIYTSCSNICPLITARLAQVKDLLGDRVGRDVFFYSITIDPQVDGPEILKKYAQTYHAGPGWMFLTGEAEHIDRIRQKLGERSKSKAEHRTDVMLGNGRTGEWGRDSAFSDIEVLAENIRRLDPAWRNEKRAAGTLVEANTSYTLHQSPGTALFAKACAGCHSVGYGDVVGPDLAGVLERRDPAWLRQFLREPDTLRYRKDPLALELDAKYPGARMPNLGLSETDVDDLFAFLKGQGGLQRASKQAQDAAALSPPSSPN
jgi:protein SCO1/2